MFKFKLIELCLPQKEYVFHKKKGKIELNKSSTIVKRLSTKERRMLLDDYKKLATVLKTSNAELLSNLFWSNYQKEISEWITTSMEEVVNSTGLSPEMFSYDDLSTLSSSLLTAIVGATEQRSGTKNLELKDVVKKGLIEWLQDWLDTDEEDLATLVDMVKKTKPCTTSYLQESVL